MAESFMELIYIDLEQRGPDMKLIPIFMAIMAGCYLGVGAVEVIVHKDAAVIVLGIVPLACWLGVTTRTATRSAPTSKG